MLRFTRTLNQLRRRWPPARDRMSHSTLVTRSPTSHRTRAASPVAIDRVRAEHRDIVAPKNQLPKVDETKCQR